MVGLVGFMESSNFAVGADVFVPIAIVVLWRLCRELSLLRNTLLHVYP